MKPPKRTLPKSMIPFDSLLSDDLKTLERRLAEFRGGSLYLNAVALDRLLDEVGEMQKRARQYENEISALAWNARAALDDEERRQANRALLAAIHDPDSNVVIMPARYGYPEVPFGDGRGPA